jgi:hypothetical protein
MIEGLAVVGTTATWNLAHSAMPDAPVVPEPDRSPRRRIVRPQVAHVMRWAAEVLDPRGARTAVSH